MLFAITLLWGIDFPPELCYALLLDSVLTATLVCWCAHACRRPPGPPRPAPWAWPAALFAWPRDSIRRGQLGETESKVRRASTPRRRSPSQSTREPTQSTWAHPFGTQGALRPAARVDEARLTKARQSAAQQLTRLTTARQLLTTAQQLVLTVGSGGRTTGTGGRDDGAGSGSSYTYSEPEEEEHANPDPAGDRGGRDGAGPPGGGGGRPPGDPEPPSGGGIHGTARLPKCCACNRQGPEMVHTDAINALHFMTRPGPGDGMLLGVCLRPRAGGAMPVPDRHGNMVQGCGHLTCRQCVVDGPAVGGGMSLMCRCCAAAQVETPAAANPVAAPVPELIRRRQGKVPQCAQHCPCAQQRPGPHARARP